MFIQKFQIQNFKSFQDVTLYFNKDVNILTGKNNSGKTTVLEALSLWHECFTKLITQAFRSQKKYTKGDWIFKLRANRNFSFEHLNSIISSNFEDIFYECQIKNKIKLGVTFQNTEGDILEIKFN
ncbi:MAG: AAA family ATPase, partial [Pseudanabaena sp.]